MLFNSLAYFIFFPVFTLLYFNIPQRFRAALILAGSCYFYMSFIPKYILIILVLIVLDYSAALLIASQQGNKRKLYCGLSVVVNILFLSYYKYFNFLAETLDSLLNFTGSAYEIPYLHIILPLGLSFHTLQSLGYVIDVYKGKLQPEKNICKYACYVLFFPQLVAGPIERADKLLPQFETEHKFTIANLKEGLFLMGVGYFKKVIVADTLAIMVNQVYHAPENFNSIEHVIASLFFSLQVYGDFSGYSDIARGSAKILGFNLMLNFTQPFNSNTYAEIWRNWHISLSSWLRDYIYIPLVKKHPGKLFALLVTFAVSGLWHGAAWTYILFGLGNGVFVYISQKFKDRAPVYKSFFSKILRWLKNLILFSFLVVTFRSKNMTDAFYIYKSFFTNILTFDFTNFAQLDFTFLALALFLIIALEIVHSFQLFSLNWIGNRFRSKLAKWSVNYALFLFFLVLSILSLSQTFHQNNTFIYFQF